MITAPASVTPLTTVPISQPLSYDDAVRELLRACAWNPWFLDLYWPESAPRVKLMADAARRAFPDPPATDVLDVGCGIGFISYLFARMGYRVTATDACVDPQRDQLLTGVGVPYRPSNLNDSDPFANVTAPESADIVLLGEVIEHILHHPVGLLRSTLAALRPGGLLILTTPNPSTLMNAVRLLGDHYLLWGTHEFARTPKVTEDGRLLTVAEIHYREYPAWVMAELLRDAGYATVDPPVFTAFGAAKGQSVGKRIAKRLLAGLFSTRLMGAGYVVTARKATS